MAKKCKCPPEEPGIAPWVVTYGDMMSLLLTFFILLLSFSSIQESKFLQAMESLQSALGVFHNSEKIIQFDNTVMPQENGGDTSDVLYELRKLEEFLLEQDLDDQVEVSMTEEGIQIKINDSFLFASGHAELQGGATSILAKIAEFLDGRPNTVSVSGHTDSLPISTVRYPSNWHLSAARAIAVARQLQDVGISPMRISATGYGEFRPVADNDTPVGRAENRRVEIFMKFENGDDEAPRITLPRESEG